MTITWNTLLNNKNLLHYHTEEYNDYSFPQEYMQIVDIY